MSPLAVAAFFAFWRRWRLSRIALQPSRNIKMKILFAPDHAGERLSLDIPLLFILAVALQSAIEFVRLFTPQHKDFIEIGKGWIFELGSQPHPQLVLGSGGN